MFVIKRDGSREPLNIEQIRKQTIQAVEGLNNVSYEELELDSKLNFQDGIKTDDIQKTLIKTAASKVNVDTPDWTYVAQRLSLYDLYHRVKRFYGKKIRGNVYELITLQDYIDKNKNIFSDWTDKYTEQEITDLNSIIDSSRDLLYDYAGFCLMENMYLAKNEGQVSELPQHFHMGVSMFVMQNEEKDKRMKLVIDMYNMISKLEYINATPINANGRKQSGGLISCLLVTVDDSLDSIMAKTTELAKGSRLGSGFGVDVSRIRSVGSDISIYRNAAGGKIPFLKIFNETAVAVNQAGVRPGSFACYIESWDLEIFDFIDLRKTSGEERRRARDLFLAISYTDIFFKREHENGDWTLFDPRDVPLLTETWGERFEEAYLEYEKQYQADPSKFNPNTKVVKARDVLRYHINSWADVGMPFFMFKDTVNNKHKYQHLGPIRSSNLCCFPGDTKVYGSVVFKDESLLKQQDEKGRHYVTIKQLADYSDNRNEFMILHNNSQGGSRLNSTNDLVFAKAYKSKTFKQKLVKVVLENGSSFKCTPDHRLGLTNGDYVRADESKDRMLHTCDSKGIHVKEVIELEEKEDVYDITIASMNPANQVIHQDDKNFFIIAEDENNIDNRTIVLVHNCEVVQFTSADYTGVCNLGSINLARVNSDEDLKRVTKLANRIMDNCIDLTPYPSKESERFQKEFRSIGIGSLGIGEMLANKQIYFGSEEHISLVDHIWKVISDTIYESSQELAKEKGDCRMNPGYRNAYFMAIAPNSSSAILAGTTNGLEPVYNKIWVEENKRGSYVMTAPHINIDNFAYYQNPYEIDMFKQIDAAAAMQKHIDMAMSQNVFLDPTDLGVKKIRDIVVYAWAKGLKTLYYMRSKPPKTTGATNNKGVSCIGCAN